jgi:hypothetical protein
MSLPTASALDRVLNCPASHALPQVRTQSEAADFGTGVHAFMARAAEVGRDAALAEIADDAPHRALCEQLPLDELPAGGRREIAFAWDMASGKARVLGCGTDRDYSTVADSEFCGTADLAGALDGVGVVIDWKSGRYVGSPSTSGQLLFLSLALSAAMGLDEVRASFVYLRDDGTFYRDEATFDSFDLAAFAEKLRALPKRIAAARLQVSMGETPDVSNGPWCRHCPAAPSCPAKVALAKSFASEFLTIRDKIAALSPADAGKVYAKALEAKDLVEEVIAGLRDVARVHPIELPDGRVLQETLVKLPTKVDAEVAERVLSELHGAEVAREAVTVEKATTLTAIEGALRKIAAPGKLAKLKRDTTEALRVRGGLKEGSAPQVRAVKR